MKKKNFIFLITDDYFLNFYSANYSYFFKKIFDISNIFDEFAVINISKIFLKKRIKIKKPKLKYYEPNSIIELYDLFKNKKSIGFCKLEYNFIYYPIFFILKFRSVKLIQISNIKLLKEKNISKNYTAFELINFFLNIKLKYYIYRLLSILRIFPNIYIHFETDNERIQSIKKRIIWKISKYLKISNLTHYENIIPINSIYRQDCETKNITIPKNIVFCDAPFIHEDIKNREGKIEIKKAEEYYLRVFNFLKKIQKTFKKKIIFCLHPKGTYNSLKNFEKIKKNFIVKKFETEKFISNSFISIFVISNLINLAIHNRKRIIIISSNLWGNYVKNKINQINKRKFFVYNIDDITSFNKEIFIKFAKKKISQKNYEPKKKEVTYYLKKFIKDKKI